MKASTKYRNSLNSALQATLTIEGADMVENRYRTLRYALLSQYPNLVNGTDKEVLLNFLKDAIYLDRKLRKLTEGKQVLKKEILSQEFQINELGAEVNLKNNIKELNKLN